MNETMLRIKTAIVAALSWVCLLLGWRGVLLCVWAGMMCLDWISGSWAAKRNGEWSSGLAREGLSLLAILLDDWLRYWLWGEERPKYKLL